MMKNAKNETRTRGRHLIRWTAETAAREFEVDHRHLSRLITVAGILPGDDNKYSTKQIVSALFGSIHDEKFEKLRAERELLQIKLAQEKGDLVRVESIEKLWASVVQAMRAVILGSKLGEDEREELFLKLRDIGAAEYKKQREEGTGVQS